MAKQEGFKVRALSEAEASRLALNNGFQSIGFATASARSWVGRSATTP
jgi:hypothetical protein